MIPIFVIWLFIFVTFVNSEVICNYENSRDCTGGYIKENDNQNNHQKEVIILAQDEFIEHYNNINVQRVGKPIILVLLSKQGIQEYGTVYNKYYSHWTINKESGVEIEKIYTNVLNKDIAVMFGFSNQPPVVYDSSLDFSTSSFSTQTKQSVLKIVNQEENSEWISFGYCPSRGNRYIVNDEEKCSEDFDLTSGSTIIAVLVAFGIIVFVFLIVFVVSAIFVMIISKGKKKPVKKSVVVSSSNQQNSDFMMDSVQPPLNTIPQQENQPQQFDIQMNNNGMNQQPINIIQQPVFVETTKPMDSSIAYSNNLNQQMNQFNQVNNEISDVAYNI